MCVTICSPKAIQPNTVQSMESQLVNSQVNDNKYVLLCQALKQ